MSVVGLITRSKAQQAAARLQQDPQNIPLPPDNDPSDPGDPRGSDDLDDSEDDHTNPTDNGQAILQAIQQLGNVFTDSVRKAIENS